MINVEMNFFELGQSIYNIYIPNVFSPSPSRGAHRQSTLNVQQLKTTEDIDTLVTSEYHLSKINLELLT